MTTCTLQGDYCAIIGNVALTQIECSSNSLSDIAVSSYKLHRAYTAEQFLSALREGEVVLDVDATCIATNYQG